jgi:hypothetical protein
VAIIMGVDEIAKSYTTEPIGFLYV